MKLLIRLKWPLLASARSNPLPALRASFAPGTTSSIKSMRFSTNLENIHRHDQKYSKIYGHLLAVAQGYSNNRGPLYTKHTAIHSSTPLWQWLHRVNSMNKGKDLQKLLLATYSKEVKDCRCSPEWSTNIFAHLPAGMPSRYGTYLLKTSSGYTFTGSSFGGFFSTAKESGSNDHPSKAVVTLSDLSHDFNGTVSQGFRSLLQSAPTLSEKGKLNLWLLRECSKPDVKCDVRALSTFSSSLCLDVGFSPVSRPDLAFIMQLMETIDTIYNGTLIDKDYGSDENQASHDLNNAARNAHMPERSAKGVNRVLACYDIASEFNPNANPKDPLNQNPTSSDASSSQDSSTKLSHTLPEEPQTNEGLQPIMMVLGF